MHRALLMGSLSLLIGACASARGGSEAGRTERTIGESSRVGVRAEADRCLADMDEQPLSSYGPRAYRFTWMPAFNHPISIRAIPGRDGAEITAKILEHPYNPTRTNAVIFDRKVHVSRDEWVRFEQKLAESGFWQMSIDDPKVGMDGSDWVLEAADGAREHAVVRWSPRAFPAMRAFADLCSDLVRLAPIQLEDREDENELR